VPGVPGQRPPFQLGNKVALGTAFVIHGSCSERHCRADSGAKERATAGLDYLSPRFTSGRRTPRVIRPMNVGMSMEVAGRWLCW